MSERNLIGIFAALVAWRILYLLITPLSLVGDEAYYWDWGRQLSWGYFSKPPGIAWLMALAGFFGNPHDWGIRLWAVIFSSGSLICSYLLGRVLFGPRVAFYFGAALALAPAAVAQNLLLTIDAPLLFFWMGSMLMFWKWTESESAKERFILVIGLTLFWGLGNLSKQMMMVFPALALLFLALEPGHRHRLKSPAIYLAALLGLSFLMPTLVWNSQNDWITISHTAHHFESASMHPLAMLSRLGELVGGELGILGPAIGIMVFVALYSSYRRVLRKELNRKELFLFVFSVPAITVMLFMCLRQRINMNWPLVFFPPLLLLTIYWALQPRESGKRLALAGWLKPGLWISAGLSAMAYLLTILIPLVGLNGTKVDPTVRLRGWKEAAYGVHQTVEELGWEEPFIMTYGHRYVTGHLAFYLPGQPRVYRWPRYTDSIESQYELWGGLEKFVGQDALIVQDVRTSQTELPEDLLMAFEEVEYLKTVSTHLGADYYRDVKLYIGKNLRHGPKG